MKRAMFSMMSVVLSLAAVVGCSSERTGVVKPSTESIHVQTAVVAARSMPQTIPLTGNLTANQQANVATSASGKVVRTFVERGSFVKEGDPLVQLDLVSAQLSEAGARANLEVAQAQEKYTQSQCARNKSLVEKGMLSQADWESAENQCKAAAATSKARAAEASITNKPLRDSTIRAPFSGLVGERFVSVGEAVDTMYNSKVASLVQITPLRLQLTVPEDKIGAVKVDGKVNFHVAAFPNETFTAAVAYIAPSVRSTTRDLVFEALVPNKDARLRPGMFASAELKVGDESLPVVPRKAVQSKDGTSRLYMVVKGVIEERVVQLGQEIGEDVVVTDGVKAGERYVVEPSDKVRDGVAISNM